MIETRITLPEIKCWNKYCESPLEEDKNKPENQKSCPYMDIHKPTGYRYSRCWFFNSNIKLDDELHLNLRTDECIKFTERIKKNG